MAMFHTYVKCTTGQQTFGGPTVLAAKSPVLAAPVGAFVQRIEKGEVSHSYQYVYIYI